MARTPVLLMALGLCSCFPYYGQPEDSNHQNGTTELTNTHTGWRDPACGACHPYDAHNDGLDPYECVVCHGTNGARSGHTFTSPCAECHGQPHGPSGYPDPESCQTCHLY